jgi:hypothetical protein
MLRRRRENKKLLRIARMLRELDSTAGAVRPAPRRVDRVAVGRV